MQPYALQELAEMITAGGRRGHGPAASSTLMAMRLQQSEKPDGSFTEPFRTTLHVSNLPERTTPLDLAAMFCEHGCLIGAKIIKEDLVGMGNANKQFNPL